jgi:maltose O-acetyltransferase
MKSIFLRIFDFIRLTRIKLSQQSSKLRYKIYILRGYQFGRNVTIGPKVNISRSTKIGDFVTLVGCNHLQGDITIGNNVVISRDCTILATNHDYNTCDALPYGTAYNKKTVTIEDNTWIGAHVLIVPGVTIGEGSIIGMGSVVVKDVPPLAVVGGNPAKVIKYRDERRYWRLVSEKKYLNRIRGPWRASALKFRKNRSFFLSTITSRGFVLNIELISPDPEDKSSILYELARNRAGTIFGNAERYHIAVVPSSLTDIPGLRHKIIDIASKIEPDISIVLETLEDDLRSLADFSDQAKAKSMFA